MKGTKCYGYKQYENKGQKYGKYILAEINVEKSDVNEDIRIINSFEENKRTFELKDKEDDFKYENEKEIKENCKIKINDEEIGFNYFYKFKEEGKYILEYTFENNIKNVAYMFCDCSSLENIYLSNFNTQNVTDMRYMFYKCNSLTNIDLSNFNTQNVTNMSFMFSGCYSLKILIYLILILKKLLI